MSVSEARAALPAGLDRVAAGEEVTITRHGQPVAVVVRPDVLRLRRADRATEVAREIHEALAAGRTSPLPAAGALSEARAEGMITLAAAYQLKAADAVHLGTAVGAGCDRWITNNRRDFPKAITEVSVTYPDELAEPP